MHRNWFSFIGLLLLLTPSLALAQHHALVDAKTLTLRDKPAKAGVAVGELLTYEPVEVLQSQKNWTQIKTTQGQSGWVLSSYLTKNAFVSADQEQLNARRGPGTQYEVIIEYKQTHLPLCVLDVAGNGWLFVMDFDGDRSWINPKMVNADRQYVIIRKSKSPVRRAMNADKDLAYLAEKGVILQVIEDKAEWLHVRDKDGDEGWVTKREVFGALDEKDPSQAKEKEAAKRATTKKMTKKSAVKSEPDTSSAKKAPRKKSASDSSDTPAPTTTKKRAHKKSATDDSAAPAKKTSTSKKTSAPSDDDPPAKKSAVRKKAASADTEDDPPAKKPLRRRQRKAVSSDDES